MHLDFLGERIVMYLVHELALLRNWKWGRERQMVTGFLVNHEGDVCDYAVQCLKRWGFRRCEDICWIKTNIKSRQNRTLEPNAVLNRTKVKRNRIASLLYCGSLVLSLIALCTWAVVDKSRIVIDQASYKIMSNQQGNLKRKHAWKRRKQEYVAPIWSSFMWVHVSLNCPNLASKVQLLRFFFILFVGDCRLNLEQHLQRSGFCLMQEHCLMGIKGTVKRSTDGDFIHANVDIDLIIEDEPEFGSKDKPVEIFHIVEHFCLGRRRLHLFGRDSTIRPGWLTLGSGLTSSNFDAEVCACPRLVSWHQFCMHAHSIHGVFCCSVLCCALSFCVCTFFASFCSFSGGFHSWFVVLVNDSFCCPESFYIAQLHPDCSP